MTRIHSCPPEAAVLNALLVPVIPKGKYSNVYFCNSRKLRARQNYLDNRDKKERSVF
jgi:hypothetical protein